jgi:hypothetical protein
MAALQPAEPAKPKPPEPAPTLAQPDEVAWQRIASSTDAVDFESFARVFPDSVDKAEADAKAKSLGAKTEPKTAALEPAPPLTLQQDSAEISSFITGPYLLNPRRNTSDFAQLYADVVDYWGKANTKLSAVVSDKLSYFKTCLSG